MEFLELAEACKLFFDQTLLAHSHSVEAVTSGHRTVGLAGDR
jgi:hypothetical protein